MKRIAFLPLLPAVVIFICATLAASKSDEDKSPSVRALPTIAVHGVTFDFVRLPSGEFLMGSENEGEGPRHRVRVRSFALGLTEVTVRQFRVFCEVTGYRTDAEKDGSGWICLGWKDKGAGWRSRGYWSTVEGANWRNPGFPLSDDDPVVALSWHDAVSFTDWLSRETGGEYRLPSEAEWEYAARAGSVADQPSDLDQVAWWKDNSQGRTQPVAQKRPNAWGLCDMLGNAWEWVADVWSADYESAPLDGSPRRGGGQARGLIKAGDGRPLRGGAWGLETAELRYSARPPFGSHQRCNNSGFRIARSLEGAAQR